MSDRQGTLVTGFADPVLDAQGAFRRLLDAMAHPGRAVEIAGCPPPPDGLHPASFAVALTLFDGDTPLWLSPGLRTAATEESLRFHCGSRRVADPADAAFAIVAESDPFAIGQFDAGEERYPDRSATLVVQVAGLAGGVPVDLSGPGIDGVATVGPVGLPRGFWADWAANHARYPLGIDLILVSGAHLLALPRSVAAQPVEA